MAKPAPPLGGQTRLTSDYLVDVTRGQIPGVSVVHKRGHNEAIGTTYEPITDTGTWPTPVALTGLEVLSTSTDDTLLGTGARTIHVEGISTDWERIVETVEMNGTTAVVLDNSFYRVLRVHVLTSGSYATETQGSHAGTITLQEIGGGTLWASVVLNGFPIGQTEIGAYTVPKDKVAFIKSVAIHVSSNKEVDVVGFSRDLANVGQAPFGAMKAFGQYHGVSGHHPIQPDAPLGPFYEYTDIGFMGKVITGAGAASIDFEILLYDHIR